MSADIQERWMRHKAPLLEGRTRGRSSCPPGQAAIRLPPSCQGLEKWPIHTQDIGSVFKDRQDTGARNTYTGRCVFLATRDTHWRTFRRESKNTLKKKKKTHTYKHALYMFNNSEQIHKPLNYQRVSGHQAYRVPYKNKSQLEEYLRRGAGRPFPQLTAA